MTPLEPEMRARMTALIDKLIALGAKPRQEPIDWAPIERALKIELRPEHKFLLEHIRGFRILNAYNLVDTDPKLVWLDNIITANK